MMKEENIYFFKIYHKKRNMNNLKNWNTLEVYFLDTHLKVYGFGVNGFLLILQQVS